MVLLSALPSTTPPSSPSEAGGQKSRSCVLMEHLLISKAEPGASTTSSSVKHVLHFLELLTSWTVAFFTQSFW